jgi:hypothetical protein
VIEQWEQIVELKRLVAALHDEIVRLEGGPGWPKRQAERRAAGN